MHYVIGTSRRRGKRRGTFKNMFKGMDELVELARFQRVAILFGREQKGLKTEETEICSQLYYIPTGGEQPSLNLAQAVMVMAYELARTQISQERPPRHPPVTLGSLDILFDRLRNVVRLLEFPARGNRDPEKGTHRQLTQIHRRAQIAKTELDMLHSVCTQVEQKLSPEEVRQAKRVAKKSKSG